MEFKLGSDPELMLCDVSTGALKSAIPIIEDGKGGGIPIGKEEGNSVIHDNVLLEFNTRPSESEKEFIKTINSSLAGINDLVSKSNLRLLAKASDDFPEEELDCDEAKKFGCDPDYNAWTLKENNVAGDAAESPFRSAGGHLHIGMPDKEGPLTSILSDPMGKVSVIKALDTFCGIISVFIDKDPTSAKRRSLYGGAGAHRPKDYGVEYRALGNWWVSSPTHTKLVYQLAEVALKLLVEDKIDELVEKIDSKRIIYTINKSDVKEARKIFNEFLKPLLPAKTARLCTKADKYTLKDLSEEWKF
jgi:hypothetical protein